MINVVGMVKAVNAAATLNISISDIDFVVVEIHGNRNDCDLGQSRTVPCPKWTARLSAISPMVISTRVLSLQLAASAFVVGLERGKRTRSIAIPHEPTF